MLYYYRIVFTAKRKLPFFCDLLSLLRINKRVLLQSYSSVHTRNSKNMDKAPKKLNYKINPIIFPKNILSIEQKS